MRRYRSKHQRPCDFCRRRRSACRIDSGPPCGLCRAYGRECTFEEAPPPRRKPSLPSDGDSSSNHHVSPNIGSTEDATETSMATAFPRSHDRSAGLRQDLSSTSVNPTLHVQRTLSDGERAVMIPDQLAGTDLIHDDLRGGLMDACTLNSEDMAFINLLAPPQLQQSLLRLPSTVIGPTDPSKCNAKTITCESVVH